MIFNDEVPISEDLNPPTGEVKLEAVTNPLYDTPIATNASTKNFFLNPGGRSRLFTNIETAGNLTWQKRRGVKSHLVIPIRAGRDVVVIRGHHPFMRNRCKYTGIWIYTNIVPYRRPIIK